MRMRMRMRDSASITCLIGRYFDRQNRIIIFVGSRKWCFFKIPFFAPGFPTWNSRRFAWRAP